MSRPINVGDVVELWWVNLRSDEPNVTPRAKVLSTPGGSGDLFYFELPNGDIIGINGNGAGFEGMRKLEAEDG